MEPLPGLSCDPSQYGDEGRFLLFIAAAFFLLLSARRGVTAVKLLTVSDEPKKDQKISWAVPWNRSANMSCAIYGVVNAAVLIYLVSVLVETLVRVGLMAGGGACEAVRPHLLSATLLSLVAFVLIFRAYVMIAGDTPPIRKGEKHNLKPWRYVNKALRNRGLTSLEVVGIPAGAIAINGYPLVRALLSAFL